MNKNIFIKLLMTCSVVILLWRVSYTSQNQENLIEMMDVILGTHTLNFVKNRFGEAEILNDGDASSSRSYVCYSFNQNGFNQIAIFSSDNELAGPPDYKVTKIELYLVSQESCDLKKCREIVPNKLPSIALIGSNKQKLAHYFGLPSGSIGVDDFFKSLSFTRPLSTSDPNYDYWNNKKGCFSPGEPPFLDITITIAAKFEKGKLIKLIVNRIESIC